MVDARAFREAIRTVTVDYPIPFIFSVLLAFALGCFIGAMIAASTLRWILAGSAVAAMLTALVIVGYGVIFRPDLLRSARFTLLNRYFEVIGDNTMTPEAQAQINILLTSLDDETRKERSDTSNSLPTIDNEEESDA